MQDIADHPLTDASSTVDHVKRAEDKEKLEMWKRNAKAFASITLTMPKQQVVSDHCCVWWIGARGYADAVS
jgi:hypothetical protein